jgi:hypothetical protein
LDKIPLAAGGHEPGGKNQDHLDATLHRALRFPSVSVVQEDSPYPASHKPCSQSPTARSRPPLA